MVVTVMIAPAVPIMVRATVLVIVPAAMPIPMATRVPVVDRIIVSLCTAVEAARQQECTSRDD